MGVGTALLGVAQLTQSNVVNRRGVPDADRHPKLLDIGRLTLRRLFAYYEPNSRAFNLRTSLRGFRHWRVPGRFGQAARGLISCSIRRRIVRSATSRS
jgi:hypothetical protein